MLSLKNVFKQYKSKSGKVVALSNITFNTACSGILFITGKSGSGKTTLLNVISRLDKYDSGDIIFDNISYNSSINKEFDSIRNKYIGYVFQEYNLIEHYNVYQNIELAVNLQNKIADEKSILDILEKVGLKGYQYRMPNELSGGQKQRVAIARALIKKPKIILCDEPTGALDEETGEDILKLLKKISEECLIIIASHNYGLVNKYSDRIIKLDEGKIVNDSMANPIDFCPNYTVKNDVKHNNYKLYIKKKIAFSFELLKRKKNRLFIAIFLALITLILFSFSSAIANNDTGKLITGSMINNNEHYISYKKSIECISDDGHKSIQYINMSENDIFRLSNEFKLDEFDIVYDKFNSEIYNFKDSDFINDSYRNTINGFVEIDEAFLKKYDYQLFGSLPENDNEIVITKFLFDMFCHYGYKRFEEECKVVVYEDILDKVLWLKEPSISSGGMDFKIVGIIDTLFKNDRYDSLNSDKQYVLEWELSSIYEYGIHNIVFFKKGFYKQFFSNIDNNMFSCDKKCSIESKNGFKINEYFTINTDDICNYEIYYNQNYDFSETKNKKIILPISIFCSDLEYYLKEFVFNYAYQNFNEIKEDFVLLYPEAQNFSYYYEYIINNGYIDDYTEKDYVFFRHSAIELLIKTYNVFEKMCETKIIPNLQQGYEIYNVDVIGVYDDLDDNQKMIYASDDLLKEINYYEGYNNDKYKYILVPFSKEYDQKYNFYEITNEFFLDEYEHITTNHGEYQFSYYRILNEYVVNYEYNEGMLILFQNVFKYVGVFLLMLVIFFIYFYFSGVVFDYKKNIGILRALGISKTDILKIFMISSLTLAIIMFIISNILTILGINLMNNLYFNNNNNFNLIKMISFSYQEIVTSFIISIFSVSLGIIIPTVRIIGKMPIDIIFEK